MTPSGLASYSIDFGSDSDGAACADLWAAAAAHRDTSAPSSEVRARAVQKLMCHPRQLLVMSSAPREILGYSLMFFPDPRSAHLSQLAVTPTYQGQGLGRALVQRTVAEAAKCADVLTLTVLADNSSARSLYESLEWIAIDTSRFADSGRENVTYRLPLTGNHKSA